MLALAAVGAAGGGAANSVDTGAGKSDGVDRVVEDQLFAVPVDGEAATVPQPPQADHLRVQHDRDDVRDDLTADPDRFDADRAEGVAVSGKERHCSLLKLDRLFGGDQSISDASWDAADGCAGIDGHVERLGSRPLAKRNRNGEYVWSRELERNYVPCVRGGRWRTGRGAPFNRENGACYKRENGGEQAVGTGPSRVYL